MIDILDELLLILGLSVEWWSLLGLLWLAAHCELGTTEGSGKSGDSELVDTESALISNSGSKPFCCDAIAAASRA
jgi:hypothetical protein